MKNRLNCFLKIQQFSRNMHKMLLKIQKVSKDTKVSKNQKVSLNKISLKKQSVSKHTKKILKKQ